MPRLTQNDDMQSHQITGGGNFNFTATRVEKLGATEYTLGIIAVDTTGSTFDFAAELRKVVVAVVEACKKSPRANNLLLRVVEFNSTIQGNVREIHGFKLLKDIDLAAYPDFYPNGMTPLNDAAYSALGALGDYGKTLTDQDFSVNGIGVLITDGGENASMMSTQAVRGQIEKATKEEILESLVTILVGINATSCRRELEEWQRETGIGQYVDAGDATPQRLAKLADFVSRSISSQSQALGTGGPSQPIQATF